MSAALAIIKNLGAKTFEGKELIGFVTQFPNGVVQFYFHTFAVCLVDVGFLQFNIVKRVVNVGIYLIGMMDINDSAIPIPALASIGEAGSGFSLPLIKPVLDPNQTIANPIKITHIALTK